MNDPFLLFLLCGAASSASFLAGLLWRDRRSEREGAVFDAAICQLDERLEKVERVVLLSGE